MNGYSATRGGVGDRGFVSVLMHDPLCWDKRANMSAATAACPTLFIQRGREVLGEGRGRRLEGRGGRRNMRMESEQEK